MIGSRRTRWRPLAALAALALALPPTALADDPEGGPAAEDEGARPEPPPPPPGARPQGRPDRTGPTGRPMPPPPEGAPPLPTDAEGNPLPPPNDGQPVAPPAGQRPPPPGGDAGTERPTPPPNGGSADPAPVTPTRAARDADPPASPLRPDGETERQRAPSVMDAEQIDSLDGTFSLEYLVKFFGDLLDKNFMIADEKSLQEQVTFIGNEPISPWALYQAFLQALELHGYTIVDRGGYVTLSKTGDAAQMPIQVYTGGDVPLTSAYITQVLPLENVSVSDVNSVVQTLSSKDAKVIAYNPSNTLIITDTGRSIRRVAEVLAQLDVAAPKSRMEIIPIVFAEAEDIKSIIEELYGTASDDSSSSESAPTSRRARSAAARRRARRDKETETESVTAGKESNYISKVIADDRTNSLIVIANDQGMEAVQELIAKLDVDVDLSSRSQIHVVYLEHSKAEDVANVLSNLSEGGTGSSRDTDRRRLQQQPGRPGGRPGETAAGGTEEGGTTGGAIAAFDSGMRITSDENTNSLVIIASQEDFRVVKSVIDQLDRRRRQVFVDAVILEIASDDSSELGLAYHGPFQPAPGATGIMGAQLGALSTGLSQDLLSGLALGVFGEAIEVVVDGLPVEIPAFGVVLQALRSNSAVSIVSNPNLMTLDNEEAKIVVGRKVPFPQQSGLSQFGQPVVSYQREDVAVTLKLTPRINSSNFVTLELVIEASEIEEDNRGLDVNSAGFVTSKREIETSALVKDNQTIVLGGLVGITDNEVETKVPVLGDLPIIGALFRGRRSESRKTNLMVFLTPHIVDDEEDIEEIMRVKAAQRQEFLRRFYGKSRDEQMEEIDKLMRFSMNQVDEASMWRGNALVTEDETLGGRPMSDDTRNAINEELERSRGGEPGEGAGELPDDDTVIIDRAPPDEQVLESLDEDEHLLPDSDEEDE